MVQKVLLLNKRPAILLVEDEPFNLLFISSALKGEYNIFTALNGYDAINLVSTCEGG